MAWDIPPVAMFYLGFCIAVQAKTSKLYLYRVINKTRTGKVGKDQIGEEATVRFQ